MIWSLIATFILLYLALVLVLFFFQANFIYFPIRQIEATPAMIGLGFESVQFRTEDGLLLSGWFIPSEGADYTILYFHGNGGNISHRLDSLALLHRLELNVFIIDYRGYGQSEGSTTEHGTYLDAEAAWRHLTNERGIEPERIIILGRSLGGAVATWLATRHPPKVLILESTFTSVPDMGARQFPFLPVRLLARIQYNTLERLPKIDSPLLIVHSQNDEVIPYSHGKRLFQAASNPKEFLEIRGGHNDGFIVSGLQYEEGLRRFINKYTLK